MKTRQLTFVLFAAAHALAVCACTRENSKETESKTVYRQGEPPVAKIQRDDPEIVAAVKKAKASLNSFITEFKNPRGRDFTIRISLPVPDGSLEHIWVDVLSYSEGRFKGTLANEPLNLPGRKYGDPVEVKREDVSDWMIVDDNKTLGGFTAKVLMEREN